ncbi:MAG: hypothetical protein ACR2HF_16290 [Methylococcaceae bacterium]
MMLGQDGVDHLNIWNCGETALGAFLDQRTQAAFIHNLLGRFCSIESFWKYVLSAERYDEIRSLSGRRLRNFERRLTRAEVYNFRAIIMDANWQKLQQYPRWAEMLKDSALKLECYYIYKREDGIRIRPDCGPWLISGFEEIRKALQEDRLPNFQFLKNRPQLSIVECLKFPKLPDAEAFNSEEEQELIALSQNLLNAESDAEMHTDTGLDQGLLTEFQ